MPFSRFVAALSLVLSLLAQPLFAQATTFALKNVIPPRGQTGATLTILVSSSGTPPPEAELEDKNNWRLAIVNDQGSRPVAIDRVDWAPTEKIATLTFASGNTYGADLERVGWRVAFIGSQVLTASVKAAGGPLKAAKGKEDASLYAFGSFLVGRSTKPIYVIDLKADYHEEIRTTGWLWNLSAAANTNTSAEPPVDKTRIDPDAIKTVFSLVKRQPLASDVLNGLKYTFGLIEGEFTRKNGVAAAVTTGQVQFDLAPVGAFALYPSVGYEVGHAIKRPEKLFEQPVDLSDWKGIVRGVAGATAQWTLFKKDPDEDDWYVVTISGTYAARFPALAEPFAEPGTVEGKRVVVTTLRKNTRQAAEAELDWNLLKYTSLSLKYKYGAEPPVFQLVDHQWTIGITLKAAQSK